MLTIQGSKKNKHQLSQGLELLGTVHGVQPLQRGNVEEFFSTQTEKQGKNNPVEFGGEPSGRSELSHQKSQNTPSSPPLFL